MPIGKPFKKGLSGNPKGRPPLPPEVRKLKQLTLSQLNEVVSLVMASTYEDLKRMANDDQATVIQRMSAALAIQTIGKGNPHTWNALLEQFRGKLKEKVEVTGNGLQSHVVVTIPSNGSEKKG